MVGQHSANRFLTFATAINAGCVSVSPDSRGFTGARLTAYYRDLQTRLEALVFAVRTQTVDSDRDWAGRLADVPRPAAGD
jgi:hypothetical protein